MKRTFLLLALLASPAFGQASNYTSFIRQIQDGYTWLTPNIAATGTGTSVSAILEKGSVFQLWSIDKTTNAEYLLDQKAVSAFLPGGTVTVTSSDRTGDKWGIKRTRIDQPYTVTTTVTGLLSGSGLPDAATKVLAEQHVALYSSNVFSLVAATVLSNTASASALLTSNGSTVFNYAKPTISVLGTTASGEEHYVLHALADGTVSQTQLSSDFIQVWPLATGSITGITNGQVLKGSAPALTVTYTNLYPSSTTRVIAYPTATPSQFIELPLSSVVLDQKTPGSRTMTLTNYDSALPKDGSFIIEIVTTTPFGVNEKLANASGVISPISIVVDRTMEVRAMQVGSTNP